LKVSVANMCVTRIHGIHVVPNADEPRLHRRLPSSGGIVITVGEHILASIGPGKVSTIPIVVCTFVADAQITANEAQLLALTL
jgi:hypothetical protein